MRATLRGAHARPRAPAHHTPHASSVAACGAASATSRWCASTTRGGATLSTTCSSATSWVTSPSYEPFPNPNPNPNLTLTLTLARTRTLTRRPGQATSKAGAAGRGRRVRVPVQLVHDRQLGREGAPRLLVPNAMSVRVQSSSPPRRHVRLQGLGLGRRKVPEQVGSSVQTPRKPPSKRAPSGHMRDDFWFRAR